VQSCERGRGCQSSRVSREARRLGRERGDARGRDAADGRLAVLEQGDVAARKVELDVDELLEGVDVALEGLLQAVGLALEALALIGIDVLGVLEVALVLGRVLLALVHLQAAGTRVSVLSE